MIFDTHAHYDDTAFDADRDELLASLPENGIGCVVDVSSDPASCQRVLRLAGDWPFIYAAVGVIPGECGALKEEDISSIRDMSKGEKVLAIGEIGLDYHYDDPPRDVQKKWFIRQLQLARECNLPVIIHSRDAAQDTLDIIREYGRGLAGVMHCFSYGVEIAREYLKMGYFLGVGGVVTFKNSRKLKEVVEYMPIGQLVLETDCPYLAPVPFRGQRNSSLYLPYVVNAVSEIKNIPPEEIIAITEENARRLYRMD